MTWRTRLMACTAATLMAAVAMINFAQAAVVELPDGSKADLSAQCPVCHMKVEAGTLGPAAVVLANGAVTLFDGPMDLFRFVLSAGQYGVSKADIKHLFVTDYAGRKFIDATKAYYVVGSNVTSGMGPEPIPFPTKDAAEKFKADHAGKAVLAYGDVTLDHVKPKRKMLKMEHEKPGNAGHAH